MKCEYCENEVPAGVNRCPSCGATVSVEPVVIMQGVQSIAPSQEGGPATQHSFRTGVYTGEELIELKNKWCFILLGIFLGEFGIHNFYAGYIARGMVKLLLTLLSVLLLGWVSWIWAIVEICTVRIDAKGRPFASGSL